MSGASATGAASGGELGLALVAEMERLTLARIGEAGAANARLNLPHLSSGASLKQLRTESLGAGEQAIVIAAGPSLHRNSVASQILDRGFEGAIIATDSAMRYCLRAGIVPDLVLTLDPHAKRIVRWFGDPKLSRADLEADDYFSRQDMDRAFADEMRANEEIIELLEHHGKSIRLALSTSASPDVVGRVLACGMRIYWWNPMYDDPELPGSMTRALQAMNGLPCVNAGGNVGTACWMMAHAVLGKTQVALTGVDFSYYEGTPYRNTQYYREAVELVGEDRLDSIYIRVFNPLICKWFYTDPAYMWYRNSFLELARDAECVTYNCTEGGILFGEPIRFVPLSAFLSGEAISRT